MNQKSLICIATISSLSATFLAGILIAATIHPLHHNKPPSPTTTTTTTTNTTTTTPFDFGISSKASHILRSNNFTFIATLLTISPNLFLSSPETTIFAIPDYYIMSNLTIPPYMSLQLINYHISPSKLTFQDLLQKPLNTCFPTNFQNQKISITKADPKNHLLELNNVRITHPDMFLIPSLVIHGVNGPFASFKSDQETDDFPICDTNNTMVLPKFDLTENKFEWKMVVKVLGLSGYGPFAFGLYNVLDGIIKEHPSLDSMTIFVPPIIEVMQMPSSVVNKFLRSHIVPKKYSYKHLAGLRRGSLIKTLCPGKAIEITGNVVFDELLLIDRVEMTSPDLVVSKSFVVHGIARAFAMSGVFDMII